jgi:hypothetical protein
MINSILNAINLEASFRPIGEQAVHIDEMELIFGRIKKFLSKVDPSKMPESLAPPRSPSNLEVLAYLEEILIDYVGWTHP